MQCNAMTKTEVLMRALAHLGFHPSRLLRLNTLRVISDYIFIGINLHIQLNFGIYLMHGEHAHPAHLPLPCADREARRGLAP